MFYDLLPTSSSWARPTASPLADNGIDRIIGDRPGDRERRRRLRHRLLDGRRHRRRAERPPLRRRRPGAARARPSRSAPAACSTSACPAAHVTAGPLDDAGNTGTDHFTADRTPAFSVAGPAASSAASAAAASTRAGQTCAADGTFQVARGARRRHLPPGRPLGRGRRRAACPRRCASRSTPPRRCAPRDRQAGRQRARRLFARGSSSRAEDGADLPLQLRRSRPRGLRARAAPRQYPDAGDHTLQIVAVDRAGNRLPRVVLKRFTVDPT